MSIKFIFHLMKVWRQNLKYSGFIVCLLVFCQGLISVFKLQDWPVARNFARKHYGMSTYYSAMEKHIKIPLDVPQIDITDLDPKSLYRHITAS